MIIIDLNQVMIANIMMQLGNHQNAKIEEALVRHMILNSIRSYNLKFGSDYGEIVIACDDKNYWRKKIFPYYKANRKKARDKSDVDWQSIFEAFNNIREELKEYFPYRVIKVEGAEADDIIATLCHKYGTPLVSDSTERILILSGDHDFIQLQTYSNIEQYDPVRKKAIRHDNPERYLKEHIMKGDSGDGVPNFLSGDDVFITGTRQKPIRQKSLDQWTTNATPEEFCDPAMLRGWKRNEALVNLSLIPNDIKTEVMQQYKQQAGKKKTNLLNYFIKFKLKQLTENIGDF
jgi:hypothetical protein